MDKDHVSIIIPTYNQWNSLQMVLQGFSKQSVDSSAFEIILIDDGSEDDTSTQIGDRLSERYQINIHLYHTTNQGRAAARNHGVRAAKNDLLIFCDSDRIPSPDFIKQHQDRHQTEQDVIIGEQFDVFYKNIRSLHINLDWETIRRFSRTPNYFKRIMTIYTDDGVTDSPLAWMSFLVGNSSVSKQLMKDVGCFDEDFKTWGFEHFELGLRMQKYNARFIYNKYAANYHIPHPRTTGFYLDSIMKSSQILQMKHPEINLDCMRKLLLNNINVLDYEKDILYG